MTSSPPRDAFAPLAAVAGATSRVKLCTGIAQIGAPLARTREYVDIVRRAIAREAPVTGEGPHYPVPYEGRAPSGWASR